MWLFEFNFPGAKTRLVDSLFGSAGGGGGSGCCSVGACIGVEGVIGGIDRE